MRGPCGRPATRWLECPGRPAMPMCEGHHAEAMAVEAALRADPALADEVRRAVDEALS